MSKFAVFLPLILLAACGGNSPPAEAPKAEDTKEKAAAPDKASADTDDDASDKADSKADSKADADTDGTAKKAGDKKADAKPADDSPKAKRSAQDILTAPDVVFMLAFNESDVKQAAETKCNASSHNDPKKTGQCMAKGRKALEVDGYRFKETAGKWEWSTLRMQGKVLHSTHKFEIDFGPEKEGSVTIKPKGKDLGTAHGHTPGPVTFEVPNEYQIVLMDPKLGKLVYEAKIGIASQ